MKQRHICDVSLTEDDSAFATMKRATRPGMAHFAFSGPAGRTCNECEFYGYPKGKGTTLACAKYRAMMGMDGPPIPRGTPCCKYFAAKK
jgi:hypothetical protein